jgi:RimJ/RimL family protein N-acetyltransferase
MERDGYFRHHRIVNGHWWDSVQWAIIAPDSTT